MQSISLTSYVCTLTFYVCCSVLALWACFQTPLTCDAHASNPHYKQNLSIYTNMHEPYSFSIHLNNVHYSSSFTV